MNYMSFAIATNVVNDTTTLSDLLNESKTLDVSSLKQDAPNAPVRDHVNQNEADDQRDGELDAIEAFIAKHGVTKPTEEDYKPKSAAWGPQSKSKAEKLKENPDYIERRGRPRKSFTKDLSFVRVYTLPVDFMGTDMRQTQGESADVFKRAGRGRGKKGEVRETFTIHHTNIDKACAGTHTRDALIAMAQAS